MAVAFRRVFQSLLFLLVAALGFTFWLNTVTVEKSKLIYSDVVSASNSYFLYKKTGTIEMANIVIKQQNTRIGRNYAVSVLREHKKYDQIGSIYLKTLSDFNNFDAYQTFLYSIDIDFFYRTRNIKSSEDAERYEIVGRLGEVDKDRLYNCYAGLKKRYSYHWPNFMIPYFGKPVENFDYFFDVHSSFCK